jgi:hypothetical protein
VSKYLWVEVIGTDQTLVRKKKGVKNNANKEF